MHWLDLSVLVVYFIALLCVGFYFSKTHTSEDDYFLGGRDIKSWHVGLSVVATDVGGGFSIGLGGLGFTIGLSGSWMLFTGLLGAWMSAVFLIPKIKKLETHKKFSTFNDVVGHYYGSKVAMIATFITLIGYLGFTSSQLLAGAKLTHATFPDITLMQALWGMGVITILYTAFGGLKAVIYTDTVQWLILICGLCFVGIPMAYMKLGGWEAISSALPTTHLSFTQVTGSQILDWALTIVPIWFIGLTLYQRIYACRSEEEAKKAWYLAGLLEWPIMAFMGTALGVMGRAAFEMNVFEGIGYPAGSVIDSEIALPLLLTQTLGVGFLGLMMAAYFSAILSTADSCLMASAGSLVADVLSLFKIKRFDAVRLSQFATFFLGMVALLLSTFFTNVLSLMLLSYGVMVSGLFVPIMGGLFLKRLAPAQGFFSVIAGGGTYLVLATLDYPSPIHWGIGASLLGFGIGSLFRKELISH